MLLMFHSLTCRLTVQLALSTGVLSAVIYNIGFVLECPSEWKYIHMSLHHLAVMTQSFEISVLSPVLFMHVGHPYIPHSKCEEFCFCLFMKVMTASILSIHSPSHFIFPVSIIILWLRLQKIVACSQPYLAVPSCV